MFAVSGRLLHHSCHMSHSRVIVHWERATLCCCLLSPCLQPAHTRSPQFTASHHSAHLSVREEPSPTPEPEPEPEQSRAAHSSTRGAGLIHRRPWSHTLICQRAENSLWYLYKTAGHSEFLCLTRISQFQCRSDRKWSYRVTMTLLKVSAGAQPSWHTL